MIRVTACEQREKGRLKVRFDNGEELVLYRGEARAAGIEPEASLSAEEYERLLNEVVGKRAIRRAMHLLVQTDRTEYQLREKLRQGGYPPVCIDIAVAYVKSFHYIDDQRYASAYVRNRQQKLSRQCLSRKLAELGVAPEVAELALDEEYDADEGEKIRALLAKRRYVPGEGSQAEFRRTCQYLARRGFRQSDILREMKAWEFSLYTE